MYLEKLEVQGFKSFANKNELVFPGMLDKTKRGLTAVVGPNGSGKSNIADAIRWVLGEQSMKTLRGKKSEDVIFSGSDKKGKLGMAEVSLFLNNEDRQAPIDYAQVVLTRRIYRDGASEYLLNNSRVRLSDVQMLLARAKFGQKTYSVIGQGLVEGFLNTSLTERKEFFDEATGVKQFQIKRDESLNKLRGSYENLVQVEMLLAEIEPRLRSLTKQVNRLQRRGELERELKALQLNYYYDLWHEINGKFNESNKNFLDIEKTKIEKDKKINILNNKLAQMEKEGGTNVDFEKWQTELNILQGEKDDSIKKLAKINAQLELRLEAEGKFDLSWLSNKKTELGNELLKIKEDISFLKKNGEQTEKSRASLNEEKRELDKKINEISKNVFGKKQGFGDEKAKEINDLIKNIAAETEKAFAEKEISILKEIIKTIKNKLIVLLKITGDDDEKNKNDWQKELAELNAAKENLLDKVNEFSFRLSGQNERIKLLEEKENQITREIEEIEKKLRQENEGVDSSEKEAEQKRTLREIEEIDIKIGTIKQQIGSLSAVEEERRAFLFGTQRNAQALQNEINSLNNELNNLKVEAARQETRLEDLEMEIRSSLVDLKEIKKEQDIGRVERAEASKKIENLKSQLEMIGGIDPEIEKEYLEIKGRYDFLSDQMNDLKEAIHSLEKIIKELDMTIKERFDKEFKLISQKFEEYFKILFNGGHAKIIKVMVDEESENNDAKKESDNGENREEKQNRNAEMAETGIKKIKYLQKHNATGLAGVEIQATPPGKKIQTVSMLSGGERALTAIALISAIISANPSPFVVLDEVDAALDEANSERLAKILDDLSHKTQFIVITHNRASMKRANILYGVTMQDDGVSKLLSIKLEDAEKRVRQ